MSPNLLFFHNLTFGKPPQEGHFTLPFLPSTPTPLLCLWEPLCMRRVEAGDVNHNCMQNKKMLTTSLALLKLFLSKYMVRSVCGFYFIFIVYAITVVPTFSPFLQLHPTSPNSTQVNSHTDVCAHRLYMNDLRLILRTSSLKRLTSYGKPTYGEKSVKQQMTQITLFCSLCLQTTGVISE